MKSFKTIDDLDVRGKRVLLRVDFNVPMKGGVVTDKTRIEKSAPTIEELVKRGAKVILLAHLGRPDGKANPEFSLKPVVGAVQEALHNKPISFANDCIGNPALEAVGKLADGDVILLENVRFHKEEEENDNQFVKHLAQLGDIYVNDAFSAAHRAHASTEGLAHALPSAAGRLMQAELEALQRALEKPERPAMAIVGGAKVSSKVDVLGNLLSRVDVLVIGGGMANTFLLAQGIDIGKSFCDRESAPIAQKIMEIAKKSGKEIILPIDAVCAAELKAGVATSVHDATKIPANKMILDIGPKTIAAIAQKIGAVKTLVWNGPLGVFETPPFDNGTNQVAEAVAKATSGGMLLSVAGGGDTVSALQHAKAADRFSYLSTAGGAFLEWLEGKELPGVAALKS